jgi:hypothetical protein
MMGDGKMMVKGYKNSGGKGFFSSFAQCGNIVKK